MKDIYFVIKTYFILLFILGAMNKRFILQNGKFIDYKCPAMKSQIINLLPGSTVIFRQVLPHQGKEKFIIKIYIILVE